MTDDGVKNDVVSFRPVGVIRSPFSDTAGMPVQPSGARGVQGTVDLFEEYAEGLKDISGFSRLILIYAFHQCTSCQLSVKPFLDTTLRGVFATRAPCRPNPIGFSVVKLIEVNGTTMIIEDVDILDGTPLLDLKPYVPAFDSYPDASAGWLEHAAEGAIRVRSDRRFG